jgi:protein TonB
VPLQAAKPAAGPNVNVAEDVGERDIKVLEKVNPAYPADARAERVEGLFVIEVVIGRDGAIRDARVAVSAPTLERMKQLQVQKGTKAALEGDGRLAEAALTAVRQWKYQPIVRDGKPVEAKATVTIRFRLA